MDVCNKVFFVFFLVIFDDVIIFASTSNLNILLQSSLVECVHVFRCLFRVGNSLRKIVLAALLVCIVFSSSRIMVLARRMPRIRQKYIKSQEQR
jgi:hypothetical protein